ncbi:hypothetical protein HID58_005673 [Brassica napus]|uniref:Uncharacterized protein n=1 Tax=Brassica napus TaxID=3708 RepID=A0ABQ8E9Y0_BRANA|nr:hypothetical protein HID58_005673 [Brassica napus]
MIANIVERCFSHFVTDPFSVIAVTAAFTLSINDVLYSVLYCFDPPPDDSSSSKSRRFMFLSTTCYKFRDIHTNPHYPNQLFVLGSDSSPPRKKLRFANNRHKLEKELKFLKNHSQPNIFQRERERERDKFSLNQLFLCLCESTLIMDGGRTLLDGEGKREETLAVISEEAGALATADGNQELKLKCHLNYCSSGLFIIPMNNLQKFNLKCNVVEVVVQDGKKKKKGRRLRKKMKNNEKWEEKHSEISFDILCVLDPRLFKKTSEAEYKVLHIDFGLITSYNNFSLASFSFSIKLNRPHSVFRAD